MTAPLTPAPDHHAGADPVDAPFAWATVPAPVRLEPRWRRTARTVRDRHGDRLAAAGVELAAGIVAVAEPWWRTRAITVPPRPALVLAAGVLGTLVAGRLPDRWWAPRLGVAATAAAAAAACGGVYVGVGLGIGLVLGDWAARRRPPAPWLPVADRRTLPAAAALVGLAAWTGTDQLARLLPLGLLLAALGVTAVGGTPTGSPDRRVGRVLRLPWDVLRRLPGILVPFALALGRGAALVVRYATFAVLAVPAVLLPWALQRLLWLDPLSAHRDPGTRWITRRRADTRPGHPWMLDTAQRPDRPLRRWRTAALGLLLVPAVLVATTVAGRRTVDLVAANPAAYDGVEWWPQHRDDLDFIATPGRGWNPYDAQRVQDVELATITVRDGRRTTWQAPRCGGCRRLTVWVYGGSTTFGFGQRDEHTVPSELARVAAAAGYSLDVVNMGVPGDLHFEEARRFGWDVTGPDGPPDLVLFYDGVNDIASANVRNQNRTNGDDQPVSLALEDFRNEYYRTPDLGARLFPPEAPSGRGATPTTTSPMLDAPQLAARAVADYERARATSRAVALASGTRAMWFWQPTRFGRPPVPGEPTSPGDASLVAEYEAARAALPDDVVDLTGVISSNRRPLFYDDIHTNEEASRLVANGMFAAARPVLDELLASPDEGARE